MPNALYFLPLVTRFKLPGIRFEHFNLAAKGWVCQDTIELSDCMGRFILNKKHFGARIVFARLVQGIFLYDFAFSISNNGHISLGNFDKINFFIYPVKGSLRHLSLFSAQGLL